MTSGDIHKIIATADPDQLRASLYKLDYILPPNWSHESVIEFANKVVDRQLKYLDLVDARASYPRWDDTRKWIPAKRNAKAAQVDEDRSILPQIVLELLSNQGQPKCGAVLD
ncbi:MAG: hypothetical protein M1830_007135 [Pleopsidium flavum]|nr:MAG: hypothetical protein M1830_007135 [Pleopsidium flavum]